MRGQSQDPIAKMKVNRVLLCKVLRKTPKEIDDIDYKDIEELMIGLLEMGDKNPLMIL